MMNIDGLSIMSDEEKTDPYLYDDFHDEDFPLVDDAVFDYEEEWFDDPLPKHSGIIIHDGRKNKNNNHHLHEHNNHQPHRNKNKISANKLCYLPPCDPYSPDAINHGHDDHHHGSHHPEHVLHHDHHVSHHPEHVHHDHRHHPKPVHHVAHHHPEPLHLLQEPIHHQNFIPPPPPDFHQAHYQHVHHHPTPKIKTVYPNLIPRPRPSFLPPVHNPNWSAKLSTPTTQIPHLLSTIAYELPSLSLNALFSSLTPPSTTFTPPILPSIKPRPSPPPPISSHHDWSDLPPVQHPVPKISSTEIPHHVSSSPASITFTTPEQSLLHFNTLVPTSSNSLDLGALPALPSSTTPSTLYSSPIPLGPAPSTTFAPPPIFPHFPHEEGHDLDVAHHGSIGLQTSLIPPLASRPSVRFQASNFLQPPATTPVTYGTTRTTTTLEPLVNGLHYTKAPPSNLASQIVVHSTTTSQPLLLLFKQKKTTSSPTSSSSSTAKNTLFEALASKDTKESDLKRKEEKNEEGLLLHHHQHLGQYPSLPSFSSIFSPSALSEELSRGGEGEEMGYYIVHPPSTTQKESEIRPTERPQKTHSDNLQISSSHDTVGYNL